MEDSSKEKGTDRSASVLMEIKMFSLETQKSLHGLWCKPWNYWKLMTREQHLREGLAQQRGVRRWKVWFCILLFWSPGSAESSLFKELLVPIFALIKANIRISKLFWYFEVLFTKQQHRQFCSRDLVVAVLTKREHEALERITMILKICEECES